MPSFQISDPPPNVAVTEAIEGGRAVARGTVSFVVENKTPVKRMATVRIVPATSDDPGNYLIAGASATMPTVFSLDFEPNQSQTVQVSLTVPRGPSAKKGAFRLRVAKDSESDDDSLDSRPVAFDAAALPAAPAAKAPFPWWAAIAAIVILLAVGGAVWYFLTPKYPGLAEIEALVVGKPIEQAESLLQPKNLITARRVIRQDSAAVGKVISVLPDASDKRKIDLVYDPGVVGLVGKPLAQATTIAHDSWGLIVSTSPDFMGQDPGLVGNVTLGADASSDQSINLSYDPGVSVPNLTGKGVSAIQTVFSPLSGKAFPVIQGTTDNPNSCDDTVTSQSPANAANLYRTGTSFFFTVARGTKASNQCFVWHGPIDNLGHLDPHLFTH